MGQRFVYLAFDNIKKCFYKKTTLISIIGLAFILGYSAATFMIEESSLKVQFSSNDYVIYFFNDFIISGIFLGVLFIISLVGMFWGNGINYMWISRLSGFKDVFRLFALSIFLWVICYMTFVVCLVFMVGGIIKEYSSHWSSGAVEVTLQKEFLRIDTIYSPT
ncbi:MAG: hypothetical protein RR515_02225, partial [Clostridium sp.]